MSLLCTIDYGRSTCTTNSSVGELASCRSPCARSCPRFRRRPQGDGDGNDGAVQSQLLLNLPGTMAEGTSLPADRPGPGRLTLTDDELKQPRSRMSLHRTVLAEGQRQDLIDFLNRDLLTAQWPMLRTLISRPAKAA